MRGLPVLLLLVVSVALDGVMWVHAQEVAVPRPTLPRPGNPDEITALDELLVAAGIAPTEAEQIVALSRLLSSPCDQVIWLARRIAALDTEDVADAAQDLATRAQQRAEMLAPWLAACPGYELTWLLPPPPRPPGPRPLLEVSDPTVLSERIAALRAEGQNLYAAPAAEKLALLARGVAPTLVFPGGRTFQPPAWDGPRRVLTDLLAATETPGFSRLLTLKQQLVSEYTRWQATVNEADAPSEGTVASVFQLAAALLDRALGLDPLDRAAQPGEIPYDDVPTAWAALAADFDDQALRLWAALGRMLAAAPPAGGTVDPDVFNRLQALWGEIRTVNTEVWPALDAASDGWLVRLASGRLVEAGRQPLAADFNAGRRAARRAAERTGPGSAADLLARAEAAPADRGVADGLLQAMQRMKAADAGTDVNPLTLAEVVQALGGEGRSWVYLYLELGALRAEGGTRHFGVALYPTEYSNPLAVNDASRFATYIVTGSTPQDVVEAALRAPGLPLAGGQVRRDARLILAPDGPPAAEWFGYETTQLLPRIQWPERSPDIGWVVYVPTATALSHAEWNMELTARAWYRLGVLEGLPPIAFDGPLQVSLRPGPPLDQRGAETGVYRLWIGSEGQPPPLREFRDLLEAKRQRAVTALPLWVAR